MPFISSKQRIASSSSIILAQVCGLEECNAKLQEDKQFTDNREALLEPVRQQAERLRKDLESVNLDILRGRDKVVYKAKEGLLTGLDKDGCLESVEQKCLCGSCAKILISGEIPQAALINGTWPG